MGRMRRAVLHATVLALATGVALAQERKELKYNVAAGGSVSVTNDQGPVTVRSGGGRQVLVVATVRSPKVEIDGSQHGNRVEVRTHALEKLSGEQGRVDYEITVPAGVNVAVRSNGGAVRVEKLRADVDVETEAGKVDVREVANGHIHVRTVSGPVHLWSVNNGHVEITSISGDVVLKSVSGPRLSVNTNKGSIYYDGDFGGAGEYNLSNNSGNIEVTVPANASIALKARSIRGSIENDLQLEPMHGILPSGDNKGTVIGTSNRGASAVELRSFSGRIRVKKQ